MLLIIKRLINNGTMFKIILKAKAKMILRKEMRDVLAFFLCDCNH